MRRLLLFVLIALPLDCLSQAPAVVDANGAVLGFYVGGGSNSQGQLRVVTNTGYTTLFEVRTGDPGRGSDTHPADNQTPVSQGSNSLVFSSANCTGQAHVALNRGAPSGFVFAMEPTDPHWYVPKNAVSIENFPVASRLQLGSGCVPVAPYQENFVREAFPNVPGVTGVPNEAYAPPLRIEVVPVSMIFQLFEDGFEETALRPSGSFQQLLLA